jgi:uncharacterized Zn-binding protein involved in type VI secretion
MPQVARIGDSIDHGGTIIEGSPDCNCNGLAIARVGDAVICDIHGAQTITSGIDSVPVNGQAIAVVGSSVSCGAVVATGSPDVNAG